MNAAAGLCATLRIDADHPSLAGHFPGNPVVPGVVLLDAVAHVLEDALGVAPRGLPSVKFLAPLLPGEAARIVLAPDGGRVRFRIERDGVAIAQGDVAT